MYKSELPTSRFSNIIISQTGTNKIIYHGNWWVVNKNARIRVFTTYSCCINLW